MSSARVGSIGQKFECADCAGSARDHRSLGFITCASLTIVTFVLLGVTLAFQQLDLVCRNECEQFHCFESNITGQLECIGTSNNCSLQCPLPAQNVAFDVYTACMRRLKCFELRDEERRAEQKCQETRCALFGRMGYKLALFRASQIGMLLWLLAAVSCLCFKEAFDRPTLPGDCNCNYCCRGRLCLALGALTLLPSFWLLLVYLLQRPPARGRVLAPLLILVLVVVAACISCCFLTLARLLVPAGVDAEQGESLPLKDAED